MYKTYIIRFYTWLTDDIDHTIYFHKWALNLCLDGGKKWWRILWEVGLKELTSDREWETEREREN